MKINIISVGKNNDEKYNEIISDYIIRISRYFLLDWTFLPHLENKEKEGESILSKIKKEDYVILLDEKGSVLRSEDFALLIENRMSDSVRQIIFIIGGAYGVSDKVKERANYTFKLSSLVFPHMLVRIILVEQIYRAITIIHGEKYHHK